MPSHTPLSIDTRRRAGLVLAVCCLSLLITALDTTAVNVALPAVGDDLHAPVSGLQWTVDGYTLAVAAFMMLAGSTADRIGRRRVFQAGLLLFTAGSLACSLAPSLGWLIAFRVAQGLGASMLNPVALSIITHAFPDPRERARAIGLWGTTVGLSLAAGPVVGGLLVASALLALDLLDQHPDRSRRPGARCHLHPRNPGPPRPDAPTRSASSSSSRSSPH